MKNCPNIRILSKPQAGHHALSSPAAGVPAPRRGRRMACCALLGALIALLPPPPTAAATDAKVLRLATTTSTENSGLLNTLLPEFQRDTGYTVHVVAVGTGKALRMARDGDADVVLVHARAAEDQFVAAGYGINRRDVMYNDFVLVGPPSDPANINEAGDVSESLRRISKSQHLFVSRGDDSGTHKRELMLWKRAGLKPAGSWYREAGQGMGKVLQIASELDAYALTDRGTWLAYQGKLHLSLLFQDDPPLHNPYGIIAVNPKRYPDTNAAGASSLIDWITSPKAQRMINEFEVDGQRLFIPLAIKVADL